MLDELFFSDVLTFCNYFWVNVLLDIYVEN